MWNDGAVHECDTVGKAASGLSKYAASKTMAEKGTIVQIQSHGTVAKECTAAWTWYENNRSSLTWDLTMFNPPWIFGVCHRIFHQLAHQHAF